MLSQADFTDAVRQALRDLHRPELLARNPLLRTRLAHDYAGAGEPDAEALRGAAARARWSALRQHPRDDKLLRAVERTYVRPAPNQEAAAELLGLPFSTYRRHLSQAVERVVAWPVGPRGLRRRNPSSLSSAEHDPAWKSSTAPRRRCGRPKEVTT